MKITVCIGSSCHIKGSRQVVEQLQYLIRENNLDDKVELSGTFCMGKCQQGVCVTVDDKFFSVISVKPDTVSILMKKCRKGQSETYMIIQICVGSAQHQGSEKIVGLFEDAQKNMT